MNIEPDLHKLKQFQRKRPCELACACCGNSPGVGLHACQDGMMLRMGSLSTNGFFDFAEVQCDNSNSLAECGISE